MITLLKNQAVSRLALMLAGIIFLTPDRGALAQELNNRVSLDGESAEVVLTSMDADCLKIKQIEVGKIFCVAVTIKSTNSAWLNDVKLERFDAIMPVHRHGMVTKPKVRATKAGEYLIEGVKLHMVGDWSFMISLLHGKSAVQVAIPVKL